MVKYSSCGNYASFLLDDNSFETVKGLWTMSKIESFVRAPRFPMFILVDILSVLMGLIIVPV